MSNWLSNTINRVLEDYEYFTNGSNKALTKLLDRLDKVDELSKLNIADKEKDVLLFEYDTRKR